MTLKQRLFMRILRHDQRWSTAAPWARTVADWTLRAWLRTRYYFHTGVALGAFAVCTVLRPIITSLDVLLIAMASPKQRENTTDRHGLDDGRAHDRRN